MTRSLGVILVVLVAGTAGAQVGYVPEKSPYLDLFPTQEVTVMTGALLAYRDPAGVAPRGGLFTGLAYEWRAGGPFHIGVDGFEVDSKRDVVNAADSIPDKRDLGLKPWPIYGFDMTMAMGLTGARTWHHLVPMVTLGIGAITDFRGRDTSSFVFGTRLSFVYGTGIRWIPRDHFQLRMDAMDHMHTIAYPESFYTIATPTSTPFLNPSVTKSRWTHNLALTLGLSYFY